MKGIESILSNARLRPMPKARKAWLEKKFYETTNAFDYLHGVRIFTSYFLRHPQEFDEKMFCRFGLLVDHLAFKAIPKKRKEFERLALKIYSYVLERVPRSYRAMWGIGRVCLHRHSPKALLYAKRAYRLAKQAGVHKGIWMQHIGIVYENLGMYENAIRWFKRGLRESPNDWGMHLNLVGYYRLRKQFRAARRQAVVLEKLIKKEPPRFLETPWGKKILEVIRDAEKPLPKTKRLAE